MSALPYTTQQPSGQPIVLVGSGGYLTATSQWTNTTGTARTLLVRALLLEQGVPSRSGSYPDATGGHLFPGAMPGQPLSYYQGLLQSPNALTATVALPANGTSAPVHWTSAPTVATGFTNGVFFIATDAQTNETYNVWVPGVLTVQF